MDAINEDNRVLREANTSQANMQELIDQYKQLAQTKSEQPSQQQSPLQQPKIDSNQIADVVRQLDRDKTEKSNLAQVQNKIKERWGDNVPTSVREQIEKLGDVGVTLAKRYPDEFLRTIGAEQIQRQTNFQSPPRSGVNADSVKTQGSQERTWSWWEDLRKKDPKLYASKKMTVEMNNDILRLGDRFMDGDFYAYDRSLLRDKYISPN
jgi:hypothetical protein